MISILFCPQVFFVVAPIDILEASVVGATLPHQDSTIDFPQLSIQDSQIFGAKGFCCFY
jgi:hypothetical protein